MTTAVEPIRVRPHVSEPSSKRRRTSSSGMERYQIFNRISEGEYGVVYRAWDKEKDELVAIKHEFHGFSQSTQREIAVLKSLPRHRNIVNLKNVVVDASQRVFVVMEYFPFDLKRFMDDKPKPYFAMAEVKSMMRQILQGVEFLHANGVMHRDLKPSNILVDREGNVKICDFGLSRRLESSRSGACTPGMVTLWYRAPEILAGAASYTSAVDMWSLGCIMAEVAMKKVLFRGTSEIDQLRRVRWFMEQPCPDYLLQRLTEGASAAGVTWLTPRGFDLLRRLLALDPNGRITAKEALRHGWFKEK